MTDETYENPPLPCEICGTPTHFPATGRCNVCWQVEKLLPTYLKSENGRRHVLNLLLTRDPDLAEAIIDMDNHGFSEGLGPDTDEQAAAWYKIVDAAEVVAERRPDGKEFRR